MQPLQRFVISQYARYWEQIGVNLNVKDTTLANIEANCRQSANFHQECFKKTLQTWLSIDLDASWVKLQKAINQAVRNVAGIGHQNVKGMLLLIRSYMHIRTYTCLSNITLLIDAETLI